MRSYCTPRGKRRYCSFSLVSKSPSCHNLPSHEKAFTALRKRYEEPDIRLTRRKSEILKLLAAGLNSRMIAHQLSLSEYTVTNHRTNLLRRFNAGNVAELIRKATGLSMI